MSASGRRIPVVLISLMHLSPYSNLMEKRKCVKLFFRAKLCFARIFFLIVPLPSFAANIEFKKRKLIFAPLLGTKMPMVRLSWPHGVKHLAMIAGDWSRWTPQVLIPVKFESMDKCTEIWTTQVHLPDVDAVYRYKFIVDGDWIADADQPRVANKLGSYDNYIKVTFVAMCVLSQVLRKLNLIFHIHLPFGLLLRRYFDTFILLDRRWDIQWINRSWQRR